VVSAGAFFYVRGARHLFAVQMLGGGADDSLG